MQWVVYLLIWCAAVWFFIRLCEPRRWSAATREGPPFTPLSRREP
jgi:hypothetical protein